MPWPKAWPAKNPSPSPPSCRFFTGHFYIELLKGIQQAVSPHKYDLILYSIEDSNNKDFYLHRVLQQRRVDGVVLASLPLSEQYAREFHRRKMPLVLVDMFHPEFDSITVNNQAGAHAAAQSTSSGSAIAVWR